MLHAPPTSFFLVLSFEYLLKSTDQKAMYYALSSTLPLLPPCNAQIPLSALYSRTLSVYTALARDLVVQVYKTTEKLHS
jgi:hypothetical protein